LASNFLYRSDAGRVKGSRLAFGAFIVYSEEISFLKMGATGFDGIRGRLNGMPSFRKLVNKAEHHISADYGQFAYA